jgi:integrase
VPSRWCTNDREYAEKFARENRERILDGYHYRKHHSLYAILNNYYKEGSVYLEDDGRRGRVMGKKTRSVYHNFMTKVLVPFLRSKKITELSELTPPVIAALQDSLLAKGNKPQTINRYTGSLRCILNYLVMHGKAEENVFDRVTMLKAKKQHYQVRGCYDIGKLKGVFTRQWGDEFSRLLCLLIYTTGIRNSEMETLRVKDMVTIDKCTFLHIGQSKTENGIRMVPLHGFVYRKLTTYCAVQEKQPEDYIFTRKGNHIQSPVYRKANADMGSLLGYTEEDLERQGISFYSGRHYWKTLMNAGGLGEIEEYFMGHKVSGNVAKRYNHLDKQGRKKLVEKAKEVYAILDKELL